MKLYAVELSLFPKLIISKNNMILNTWEFVSISKSIDFYSFNKYFAKSLLYVCMYIFMCFVYSV